MSHNGWHKCETLLPYKKHRCISTQNRVEAASFTYLLTVSNLHVFLCV